MWILTFSLSIAFSFVSQIVLGRLGIISGLVTLLIVVAIGIAFDIIGVSATKATEKPFHAMAAKHVRGAREAIGILRNADRVANFCNDVIGDICGTVSGAIGAGIVFRLLITDNSREEAAATMLMTATIAALTVGGKAMGKGFAIKEADRVILACGRALGWFRDITGITIVGNGRGKRRSRMAHDGNKRNGNNRKG